MLESLKLIEGQADWLVHPFPTLKGLFLSSFPRFYPYRPLGLHLHTVEFFYHRLVSYDDGPHESMTISVD
jgi:hypothetical protein